MRSADEDVVLYCGLIFLIPFLSVQVLDLEAELDSAVRKEREQANENRKLQRLLAEQKMQSDENERLVAQSAEQNLSLQQRVKTLKRQLEEAVSFHAGFESHWKYLRREEEIRVNDGPRWYSFSARLSAAA